MQKFEIVGNYFNKSKCFPSLNNLIQEAEKNPHAYNRTKRKYEDIALKAIRRGLRGWSTENEVTLCYEFGEPARGQKRDYSNIRSAAEKIIEDTLVKKSKTIIDDNPKYVAPSKAVFKYTTGKPYIKVTILEKGVDY